MYSSFCHSFECRCIQNLWQHAAGCLPESLAHLNLATLRYTTAAYMYGKHHPVTNLTFSENYIDVVIPKAVSSCVAFYSGGDYNGPIHCWSLLHCNIMTIIHHQFPFVNLWLKKQDFFKSMKLFDCSIDRLIDRALQFQWSISDWLRQLFWCIAFAMLVTVNKNCNVWRDRDDRVCIVSHQSIYPNTWAWYKSTNW